MPSIHTNSSGVSAGGYSGVANNDQSDTITTIYASQIIESPLRRFITDNERYTLAQLQKKSMLKDTYDSNGDNIVDRADTADTANRATLADRAINADNAAHSTTSDNATESLSSKRALLADKATLATHAETADSATNAVNASNATNAINATNANRATSAERADEADSIAWGNITGKPTNLAKTDDITWDNVKTSAPEILSDNITLENRLRNLDTLAHSHSNKEDLDKLGHDGSGKPTWDGAEWPGAKGDMRKAVYDADDDGIVDRAKTVLWDDITGKPATFPPEPHNINASRVDVDAMHRFVTDAQITSWDSKQAALGFTAEDTAKKGQPNGYASLDVDGKIPESQVRGFKWDALANKPTSSVTDIDDAVTKRHTHANLTALDKFNESGDGKPTWGGVEWPYTGDMKKDTYDTDGDGVIDHAKTADTINWSGIVGTPSSDISDIDDAVTKKHSHTNTESLNLLGKDSNNKPLWNNLAWPYDMSKAVYDTDSDGVVDEAEKARAVNWSGVVGRPTSAITAIDGAVNKAHEHTNKEALDLLGKNGDDTRATFKGKEIAFKEEIPSLSVPGGIIQGKHSVTIDSSDNKLMLVNDDAFPGQNKYYGTNGTEVRGFFELPNPKKLVGINSIVIQEETGQISLNNDNPAPNANCYYGTNDNRVLGYHRLPDPATGLPSEIDPSIIRQDDNHRFVTRGQLEKLQALPDTPSIPTPPPATISDDVIEGAVLGGTRQSIISAASNFFTLNGSDLTIKASESAPLIVSFSGGRFKETIKKLKENLTVTNVPSVINAGTAYIMLVLDGENVVAEKTGIKPIYSNSMPDKKDNGQYWFDTSSYTMYLSNGTTFTQAVKPVLFIGEITSVNGDVTVTTYAINGVYDSGWYTVTRNVPYNKNHNLGTDSVIVNAYRGKNNVNMGDFKFSYIYSSMSPSSFDNYGDAIIKITDKTIQTKRFCWNSDIIDETTQHRVIVRRAW